MDDIALGQKATLGANEARVFRRCPRCQERPAGQGGPGMKEWTEP